MVMRKGLKEQIERIQYYEAILSEAEATLREIDAADEACAEWAQSVSAAEKACAAAEQEYHRALAAAEAAQKILEERRKALASAQIDRDIAGERKEAARRSLEDKQDKIRELESYYGKKDWWEDFEASERGELPPELPCGVLSEDGIYNVLVSNQEKTGMRGQ